MYKTVAIIYFVCFFCYILFTRVPDYFEGEFITGIVTAASSSTKGDEPTLVVTYRAGSETFHYSTDMLFLRKYHLGDKVKVIYDPSNPENGSIYAIIGYWIKWPELLFTAIFFIILFGAAASITGKNSNEPYTVDELRRKRKYVD